MVAGVRLAPLGQCGVPSGTSSALEQVNDQDDNGNHEQEMN